MLVATEKNNPSDVAKEEFKQGIIPITVKRKLPSDKEVVIDVKHGIENWLVDHKGEI